MLAEYALIPNIFSNAAHGSSELAEARLQVLKPIVLEEALVRNLRAGAWWSTLQSWSKASPEDCHPKVKELLKQMAKTKRLRDVSHLGIGETPPKTPEAWLWEALVSHQAEAFTGVITLPDLAQQDAYKNNKIIARIDRLTNQDWQEQRDQSRMVRMPKQTSSYRAHLKLLFSCANAILFIDPYLDPRQLHYREFHYLLNLIKDSETCIELHLASKGIGADGNDRRLLTLPDWRDRFTDLLPTLKENKLRAQVFIWENFHDRYIITDLMGISLTGGLDVLPNATVDWTRQTRALRDQTQKDYSPNTGKYTLKHQFTLE